MKKKIAIVGHGFVPSAVSKNLLKEDKDEIVVIGSSENEGVKKAIEQLNNEGKKVKLISEEDFKKQNLEKSTINEILEQNNRTYIRNYELPDYDYDYGMTKKEKAMAEKIIPIRNSAVDPKIQNNEPCPCGSGLKYKKCCKK